MPSSLFQNNPLNNKPNTQSVQNNPNYAKAMDLIRQHNGNAQEAFFALAKEKGVDPMNVLSTVLGKFR